MAEEKNILEETTTTESVTPIELVKPAYEDDWAERRLHDMYNRDQEQRAAIAQDKIDRERFGRSLGELGRTFSDMILAAGGAPVSPRDVSRVYADLDARNQRLFETEQARRYQQQQNELAMMRQERERRNQRAQHQADLENAARQRAAEKAASEAQHEADLKWREREAERQRKWQAGQNAANRELQRDKAQMNYDAKLMSSGLNAASTNGLMIEDTMYHFNKADNKAVNDAVWAIIQREAANNQSIQNDYIDFKTTLMNNPNTPNAINSANTIILQKHWNNMSQQAKDDILNIIDKYKMNANPGQAPINPQEEPQPTDTTTVNPSYLYTTQANQQPAKAGNIVW